MKNLVRKDKTRITWLAKTIAEEPHNAKQLVGTLLGLLIRRPIEDTLVQKLIKFRKDLKRYSVGELVNGPVTEESVAAYVMGIKG